MRTILAAVSLSLVGGLVVSTAQAHDDWYVTDYSKVDTAKWCSYANQIYSRGAVIEIGGRPYVCAQETESGPGANRLVWKKLEK